MVRVSIIVPIYNPGKHFEKLLNSIINQSLSPNEYEMIFIDDKSPDNSYQVLKTSEKKHPNHNIKIFRNKKSIGPGLSRNIGIKEAKGEYILFCDSDDYIDYNSLELMLNEADRTKADLLIASVSKIEPNGKVISQYHPFSQFEDQTDKYKKLYALQIHSLVIWNRLIRTDLLRNNNILFTDLWHEDVEVMLRIFSVARNIVDLKAYLYFYVQQENSIMAIKDEIKHIDGYLKSLDNAFAYIDSDKNNNLPDKVRIEHKIIGYTKAIEVLLRRIVLTDEEINEQIILNLKHLKKAITEREDLLNYIKITSSPLFKSFDIQVIERDNYEKFIKDYPIMTRKQWYWKKRSVWRKLVELLEPSTRNYRRIVNKIMKSKLTKLSDSK